MERYHKQHYKRLHFFIKHEINFFSLRMWIQWICRPGPLTPEYLWKSTDKPSSPPTSGMYRRKVVLVVKKTFKILISAFPKSFRSGDSECRV
jgi:hypothetical protein